MATYNYIPISGIESLLEDEILAATGASMGTEELFLADKDIRDLVGELIKRSKRAKHCTIFRGEVKPVNNVLESIAKISGVVDANLEPAKIILKQEIEPRIVSIVIPDEKVMAGFEKEYLYKLRKKLLTNPINYLLGAMELFKSGLYEYPAKLTGYKIVALPLSNSNPLCYENTEDLFYDDYALAGTKMPNGEYHFIRELSAPKCWIGNIAFICEDV